MCYFTLPVFVFVPPLFCITCVPLVNQCLSLLFIGSTAFSELFLVSPCLLLVFSAIPGCVPWASSWYLVIVEIQLKLSWGVISSSVTLPNIETRFWTTVTGLAAFSINSATIPSSSLCDSGHKHIIWTWCVTFFRNVNVVCSLWHVVDQLWYAMV